MSFSTSLVTKIDKQKKENHERVRVDLLEKTIMVAKRIFTNINVQEVYITGSILIHYKYNSRSDIDIAVKGLGAADFYSTLSKLEESLVRTIELIDIENCRFSDKIIKTGLRIV